MLRYATPCGICFFMWDFFLWHHQWDNHWHVWSSFAAFSGLCFTRYYPLGVSISKQDQTLQSGVESSADTNLSLVKTSTNVLAGAETKPPTKPHPVTHESESLGNSYLFFPLFRFKIIVWIFFICRLTWMQWGLKSIT